MIEKMDAMIDIKRVFVFYLALLLGPLFGLWLASMWRDRKLRKPWKAETLFRCTDCLRFYESDDRIEKMVCPLCGKENSRLNI